jgi:hypothetical protein
MLPSLRMRRRSFCTINERMSVRWRETHSIDGFVLFQKRSISIPSIFLTFVSRVDIVFRVCLCVFNDSIVLRMKTLASVAIDLSCPTLLYFGAQMITGGNSLFPLKKRSHRWSVLSSSSISPSTCDQHFALSRMCCSIVDAVIIAWKLVLFFLSVSPFIVDVFNMTIEEVQ